MPLARFLGTAAIRQRGRWKRLPLRLAEVLFLLAQHEQGLRGEALAEKLARNEPSANAVKQALKRLRRMVAIEPRPYRLQRPLACDVAMLQQALRDRQLDAALDLYSGPLLEQSDSPWVNEQRDVLRAQLQQAFIQCDNPALMIRYLDVVDQDDLELAEVAADLLPRGNVARPGLLERIRRMREAWQLPTP
jgi:hypothetical protein